LHGDPKSQKSQFASKMFDGCYAQYIYKNAQTFPHILFMETPLAMPMRSRGKYVSFWPNTDYRLGPTLKVKSHQNVVS